MKVCGVDIKGSEAIIAVISYDRGLIDIDEVRLRKLTLHYDKDAEKLQAFQNTFKKFLDDYKIERVVIRERPQKGKFAGGAIGFKIEAALQLITDVQVEFISPTQSKELIKKNPIVVDIRDTGLKQFQELAFSTAYSYVMKTKYISDEDI
ncbi:DUF3010 family protein [Flocculibacter collagenilyticus]|uniref:DUF3010 family protein n=1 Tax=Flocculibacter collagenilyticus TaxID=2744479 RepID=UPI0018F34156|nr:DUF3010 family protein [Flocculibacter collagenilyticus]